ncbi:uncharacterized protein L3040_005214 [Drepanopeziza brunnea f. sp. 'multigermtubi']|uniref:uncharacterized protein n=1 Tax=Drepanopeziza brunnea f. sp. 'multigermtubi' TaxID=698441 RepID=UPI0023918A1C|nr:hypothetical protein L3040_005214 [Drepanopeziza brunnea f. sp. 'multigermtubi']
MSEPSNESSADDVEVEDAEQDQRPNRWQGPPSTWTSLTEAERELAASLDALRNGELGVHLYNAFALKRRASELDGKGSGGADAGDRTWRPPNYWTAWPLPPGDVPRNGEIIGPQEKDEEFTYRRGVDAAPSREMEDVLVGLRLRFAKERFEGRKSDGEDGVFHDKGKVRRRVEEQDETNLTGSDDVQSSQDEEATEEPVVKKAPSPPPKKNRLKPVVSADDERSRGLLLPSVRHTLAKLDGLLMALHHARKTCHRYSHSDAGTTDDESILGSAVSEAHSASKRPRGRPRRFKSLPNRSIAGSISVTEPEKTDAEDLLRKKTKGPGRPIKVYERLEGESQQEYLVRVARIQKKPLPVFAPPTASKRVKSPSPTRRRSPMKRATSKELRASRQKKLGLRDWSEVIGMAALVGFPEDVVERAAKRCANLFGEGMSVRRLVEVPFSEDKEGDDVLAQYLPEMIPPFLEDEAELSSSSHPELDSDEEDQVVANASTSGKKLTFCPVHDCPRRRKGFVDVAALKRHLELVHGIQKEEIEEWILPSDEEMEGAVHVDGFLRPLKSFVGSRGRYRRDRRRGQEVDANSGSESESESEGEGEGESKGEDQDESARSEHEEEENRVHGGERTSRE